MKSSRVAVFAILLGIASVAPGFAQQTGNIRGRVANHAGAAVPGTAITLTSAVLPDAAIALTSAVLPDAAIAPASAGPALRTAVSSETGSFLFARLPIGLYSLTFELTDFATVAIEGVRVTINATATINQTLESSTVQKAVTVIRKTPVVDTDKIPAVDTASTGTQTTFTREMLQSLPTARDPWVILEQAPGITMDRPNVGGSQAGEQSEYISRGASSGNDKWTLDGVDITDMTASGTSPIYYDFDMLEEMQVVTGGADASQQTGGVGINMVTRSGSDTRKGSGRYYLTNQRFVGDNLTDDIKKQRAGSGAPIQNINDYGLEMGGPIRKGKLWYWGSFAKQHINTGIVGFYLPTEKCQAIKTTLNADPLAKSATYVDENGETKTVETTTSSARRCLGTDGTVLDNYNWKLNWAVSRSNTLSFQNTWAAKTKNARDASDTRPIETTYRQMAVSSKYGTYGWDVGPSPFWKAGDQHIFSDRLLLDVQWSHLGSNYILDFHEDSLNDVQRRLERSTGVYSASFDRSGPYIRPTASLDATLSYFLPATVGGDHAFTLGARYRTAGEHSEFHVGANTQAQFNDGAAFDATLYRDSITDYQLKTAAAYLQDAFTRKTLTVKLGLRWDRQWNEALPSSVPAHPFAPESAASFDGAPSGVVWNDVSPRLGLTWNVQGTGTTVARASWAIYYGQLAPAQGVGALNPMTAAEVTFPWTDLNGDRFVQANELDYSNVKSYKGDYSPANPAHMTSTGSIDKNVKNDRTQEILVGIDHEFFGFGVGASYIYRKYDQFQWNDTLNFTSDDYAQYPFTPDAGSCPQASARCPTVTYFEPNFPIPAAYVYTNRPDYYRNFNGLELTARRRYSNRWMLNASYAYNNAVDNYASKDAYEDPTQIPQLSGAQYALEGGGSGIDTVFVNAKWLLKISGMYTLRNGINIGAFFHARQGYLMPQYILSPERWNRAGSTRLYVDPWGDVRLPHLQTLDIKIDRNFTFRRFGINPSIDVFNALNTNTVLARRIQQNSPTANNISGIVAPRVIRFGVRASW